MLSFITNTKLCLLSGNDNEIDLAEKSPEQEKLSVDNILQTRSHAFCSRLPFVDLYGEGPEGCLQTMLILYITRQARIQSEYHIQFIKPYKTLFPPLQVV